eukprot:m.55765 g.55765  ORF g.55765 m.55765 type:complete len:104 (+) comp13659_c0_seq8:496-807(+)
MVNPCIWRSYLKVRPVDPSEGPTSIPDDSFHNQAYRGMDPDVVALAPVTEGLDDEERKHCHAFRCMSKPPGRWRSQVASSMVIFQWSMATVLLRFIYRCNQPY